MAILGTNNVTASNVPIGRLVESDRTKTGVIVDSVWIDRNVFRSPSMPLWKSQSLWGNQKLSDQHKCLLSTIHRPY